MKIHSKGYVSGDTQKATKKKEEEGFRTTSKNFPQRIARGGRRPFNTGGYFQEGKTCIIKKVLYARKGVTCWASAFNKKQSSGGG